MTRAPPSYHRRHSTERTSVSRQREREREALLSTSLIFHAGIRACYSDYVALMSQRSRDVSTLNTRRVLTGITIMIWGYHSQS